MTSKRPYDLKERLVDYSVRIIRLSEALPDTKAGRHISVQLLRSGTSAAPNYAEATGAESRADFVHKVKLAVKELRETDVWLLVAARAGLVNPPEVLDALLKETDELISILFTSAQTARRNKDRPPDEN